MIQLYVHIEGLETTLVDVEEMPKPTDTALVGRNPRRRDGKNMPFVLAEVTQIIIPMNRILFIEVMTRDDEEEFETFIRE